MITMWVVIAGGMVTLLAAAMRKQKNDQCKDYTIVINGAADHLFVDEKDVVKILSSSTNGMIKGQLLASFDLRKLEQQLEKNDWIKHAELYFDNKNVLHITVNEREPIARIFTVSGKTFYLDNENKQMPVVGKLATRLPVFTGFPDKKLVTSKDSTLVTTIAATAGFINRHPFWQSQVSQIDINTAREFEMIPVVGNHIVKLGDGSNVEQKFNRLYVFYKNILSKTGFDKYKTIDVQYAGQVVATRGVSTKSDSLQLRRNVEKLLQQARDMQYDTVITTRSYAPDPELAATENVTDSESNSPAPIVNNPTNPNPLKSPLQQPKKDDKPKAVMKKRQ